MNGEQWLVARDLLADPFDLGEAEREIDI